MKKAGFIFFVISVGFITFSCAGWFNGAVWDDSVPPEQSSKVMFYYFFPETYNGITLDNKEARVVDLVYVWTFPAGDLEFSGNLDWVNVVYFGNSRIRYSFKQEDISFSCKLEPGEQYILMVSYEQNEDKKKNWYIYQYNREIKQGLLPSGEKDLVAKIPFNPPVMSD